MKLYGLFDAGGKLVCLSPTPLATSRGDWRAVAVLPEIRREPPLVPLRRCHHCKRTIGMSSCYCDECRDKLRERGSLARLGR